MNKKMLNHVKKYSSVMDDSSKFQAHKVLSRQLSEVRDTISRIKNANNGDLESEIADFESCAVEFELAIKSILPVV